MRLENASEALPLLPIKIAFSVNQLTAL
jgi:hypothetical protein